MSFSLTMRLAVIVTCLAGNASAQSGPTPLQSWSRPTIGGTSNIRPFSEVPSSSFAASAGTEILRHRDFAGKPCLDVYGFARAHTVNLNLYDHVIAVRNNCPQRIAMQLCYYQTRDCIPMQISGGERKEAVLGILPAVKDFRFEFREKF
jgi:hypothetical protein